MKLTKVLSGLFLVSLASAFCGCSNSSKPTENQARAFPNDPVYWTVTDSNRVAYLSDIPPPCLCMERQIARFDIPLNYTVKGKWMEFELKATTNNYDHAYHEYYRLQYYSPSEIAEIGRSIPQAIQNWKDKHPDEQMPATNTVEYLNILNEARDRMWLFTCTKYPTPGLSKGHFNGDTRSYRFIKNLSEIKIEELNWPATAFTVVVLVDLDALERHREGCEEWMKVKNEELIWSWCRYGYDAYGNVKHEEEPQGGTTLWHGITPTCWYSKMPKWAEEQILDYWPRYMQTNYQAMGSTIIK